MKWTKFEIENFKGIKKTQIELQDIGSNIYTIIGLNESGKTTLLEAIDFFGRTLHSAEENPTEKSNHTDFDIIPLPLRKNFNGKIILKGYFTIEEDEKKEIIKNLKIHDFTITEKDTSYSITREYIYEASSKKSATNVWNIEVLIKEGKKKPVAISDGKNEIWQSTIKEINKNLPAISYFPTFAFQIPERIYLENDKVTNEKDKKINQYFKTIIQDILDSSTPGSTLERHILERMNDVSDNKSKLY